MGTRPQRVEPIPGTPAAVVETGTRNANADDTPPDEGFRDGERALVVADYHAGLEAGLRREGVSLPSHAAERRDSLITLLDDTGAGRVVFLGDLAHSIGDSRGPEREELERLFEAVTERASAVVIKGNHDGGIERVADENEFDAVSVTGTTGVRLGDVGFAHGHTWPVTEVVRAPTLCVAHEHPTVRLTDSVGGRRVERVWLRGDLDREPFDARERDANTGGDTDESEASDEEARNDGAETGERSDATEASELVVFPAFNDLVGGTWVNVPEQDFLSPFLPDGLSGGEAYLLDGTRLGDYRQV